MQGAEPISLYCADESDGETLRACEQVNESLYAYEQGGTDARPVARQGVQAERRPHRLDLHAPQQGVKFHDGATFDATDVISTYALQWDTKFPNRIGNSGAFEYSAACGAATSIRLRLRRLRQRLQRQRFSAERFRQRRRPAEAAAVNELEPGRPAGAPVRFHPSWPVHREPTRPP